jgi:hypothetical protein
VNGMSVVWIWTIASAICHARMENGKWKMEIVEVDLQEEAIKIKMKQDGK